MPNKIISSYNIYDKLIVVLIALQVFGGIGGAFTPVRVFVILLVPFAINFYVRDTSLSQKYKNEKVFFIFWILYGLISLFWVFELWVSVKEICYLILNFLSIFVVFYLAFKAKRPQVSIIHGWVLFFILTIPIALMEIHMDVHLPMDLQQRGEINLGDGLVAIRRTASVTFANLNGYNTMLCYIIPFVFGLLFLDNQKKRIWSWGLVFILSYIILVNASRASIMCLGISYFILLYMTIVKNFKLGIKVLMGLILLIGLLIYFDLLNFVKVGVYRIITSGTSDDIREMLVSNGLSAFKRSCFFGVGAGNLPSTYANVYGMTFLSPHNLFLEISQYGLLIFLGFLVFLGKIFFKAKRNPKLINKFIVFIALLTFPLSSIISSGYILGMPIWLFLASLYIISDKHLTKINS